jgi:hypothetical protein
MEDNSQLQQVIYARREHVRKRMAKARTARSDIAKRAKRAWADTAMQEQQRRTRNEKQS